MSQSKPSLRELDPFVARRIINQQRRQKRIDTLRRKMGRNKPLTEQEIHAMVRPRSPRFWVAGSMVLLFFSYWLKSPLLVLLAMLVLSIGLIPELWFRVALRGIRFERTFSVRQARYGEDIFVTYQFENRKFLPVPWLEMEDELSDRLELHSNGLFASYKPLRQIFITSFTLWYFQRVKRRYRLTATARGVWNFGPTYLRAGDPFGFLESEAQVTNRASDTSLVVLPLIAPLAKFGLPSKYPFGELHTRRQYLEDPSQVVGARDYQPGDPIRRLHWKATARSMTLQSKVYPPTTSHTLLLFIDINTTPNSALGIDPTLLELGIAAAASVATWATEHRFAVGLMSNSLPSASFDSAVATYEDARASMRVPPGSHPAQLARLLVAMARMQPYFGASMENLLNREQVKLPMGATIIYISAAGALLPGIVQRLQHMQRHGHTVALLLTGNAAVATKDLLTYRLGGEETWNDLTEYVRSQSGSQSGTTSRDRSPNGGPDASPDRPTHQPGNQPAFTLG